MNKRVTTFLLISSDFITSLVAWFFFYNFRKTVIENVKNYHLSQTFNDDRFWIGAIGLSILWILLYALHGMYSNVHRKSRLKEFTQTAWVCIFGGLIIFFSLILDDIQNTYKNYYYSFFFLISVQFIFNFIPKFIITSLIANKIHNREIGFNTLIIGDNPNALDLVNRLNNAKKSAGYFILGYVTLTQPRADKTSSFNNVLKHLGDLKEIEKIVLNNNIEEIIISIDHKNNHKVNRIISKLKNLKTAIKVQPDMFNILSGQVKMSSILHEALVEIKFGTMSQWQIVTKRVIDIVFSSIALVVFSPLYLILAILVKFSSKGPVFFKQDRIGKDGQPFKIIKFRSMYTDAEKSGPMLSKDNDNRITPIGRFLRKSRLDELPQFFNVLKGEMSIVGPRPERQFFIDQIVKVAPEYHYLHRIKPGITSWGQVKFGYAENIDEMVERLKFDLLYIENMSILIDFKIMIHTVLVVIQGRGK